MFKASDTVHRIIVTRESVLYDVEKPSNATYRVQLACGHSLIMDTKKVFNSRPMYKGSFIRCTRCEEIESAILSIGGKK